MGKKGLTIRQAGLADVTALEELDRKIYSASGAAEPGSIRKRVETFPEGVLIGEKNGAIAAAMYIRPIDREVTERRLVTWKEMENDGDFSPPENYQYAYGVGLVGTGGTADAMMMAAVQRCVMLNIRAVYFGSRVPTLKEKFQSPPDKETVAEYVEQGEDWEIKLYQGARFLGIHMARSKTGKPVILPDYFDDPESYNYGVLWQWQNPFHKLPWPKAWSVLYAPLRWIIELL